MPTVGQPLRMSNIFAVFNATRFSQCTRGNKVPNYPANGNVATTTGALRFSQFPGATTDAPAPTYNAQMQFLAAYDNRPQGDPSRSSAFISLDSNGWAYDGGSTYAARQNFQWLLSGNASDFSVFAAVTGGNGSLSFGTTGQWLQLTGARSWGIETPNNFSARDLSLRLTLRHNPSGTQWENDGYLQAANGDPI